MHELPVTQSILETALSTARKAGARRVLSIEMVIGDLSSIVDDSVQFYFDLLSKSTEAEGARLVFRREAAEARCLDCETRFEVAAPLPDRCPSCGGIRITITGGSRFQMESIEVDDFEGEEATSDSNSESEKQP